MPPKGKSGLSRSRDDYAAHRCACGHLVYPSQRPGDPCLVNSLGGKVQCSCTDHHPRGHREAAQA
jgi:hypothetical protein